jgi:hypothetical protein
MSQMAAEMAARIAADGGEGLVGSDSSVVPGNEGGQTQQPASPAAEPSTPESTAGAGPPDTIPYARFKEVNDRYTALKGFEQLAEYGYDPDSLGRLAAFEAQYLHDPVGTWRQIGDNLDLPQPLKDAIAQHLDASGTPEGGSAEGQPSNGQQPSTQPPSPEMQKILTFIEKQEKAEAEQAVAAAQASSDQRLEAATRHWDALDTRDEIETPEAIKLMAIAATAGSGQAFRTVEDLAEAARATIVGYRSSVLGGAVQRTGHAGAPPALPGSAPGASGPMTYGTDIKAATRAAEAAIKAGQLPG